MKYRELKEKTEAELVALERQLREELFNLRLQQASGQLEKPHRIRMLRRDIARIETRLSEIRKAKQLQTSNK